MIYLDNNATTRPDPVVVEAMLPYWKDLYFNPASLAGELVGTSHPIGSAKEALAQLLGGEAHEFYLTSGATESNNWVIQSIANQRIQQTGSCHIVASSIEHPSILEALIALHQSNSRIQFELIPVLHNGQIDLCSLERLVKNDTALVSIMLANNESGVIQPVEEAATIIRKIARTCVLHTDATQAVGRIPIDLNMQLQQVDLLSLSAHKFHGPKGIGALFIRAGTPVRPWLYGGNQQDGMRAGTENPALAAGIFVACKLAKDSLATGASQMGQLRDVFELGIKSIDQGIRILGDTSPRLPNTSLLVFQDKEGEYIVHNLFEKNIIASTGAACASGSDRPSHVVIAMGTPYNIARNSLRISFSRETKAPDVDRLLHAISEL
jgi:cysteine desulfurase